MEVDEQITHGIGNAQHPLPLEFSGQYFIDQQRRPFCHPARVAARAEAASFMP